jgi:hypothetical protein
VRRDPLATGETRAVESRQSSSTYDHDLDAHPRPPRDPAVSFASYQRLIVNPLLAVAMCVAAVFFVRFSLQERALWQFLGALAWLGLSFFTVQFHCLDCGKTGWFLAARRHGCAPSMARWQHGQPIRWRLPAPKTQLIVWWYFLASATTLIVILFALSR